METLSVLIKYLGVSLLLWFLYSKLLRARISYRLQRVVLISIPLLSLAAATLSFDLIEVEASRNIDSITTFGQQREYYTDKPFVIIEGEATAQSTTQATTPIVIDWRVITRWLWVAMASLLALRYIYSLGTILRIKRYSTQEHHAEYTLCRSGLVDTPFSFFRMIFIDRQTEGRRKDIILEHERAHITHRHYIDRTVIELYTILSWFNPIVWYLRKEAEATHEFEADQAVLRANYPIATYKAALAEEMGIGTPAIANGFNHSLIKERILRMSSSRNTKGVSLRVAAALCAFVAVITLTSLTYLRGDDVDKEELIPIETTIINMIRESGAANGLSEEEIEASIARVKAAIAHVGEDITSVTFNNGALSVKCSLEQKAQPTTSSNPTNDAVAAGISDVAIPIEARIIASEVEYMVNSDEAKTSGTLANRLASMPEEQRAKEMINSQVQDLVSSPAAKDDGSLAHRLASLPESAREKEMVVYKAFDWASRGEARSDDYVDYYPADYNYYFLESDQYKVLQDGCYERVYIYPKKLYTKVDFVYFIPSDWYWISFNSNSYLVDQSNGDKYKIHSNAEGIPLDRTTVVRDMQGKFIAFTAIFPPLKSQNTKFTYTYDRAGSTPKNSSPIVERRNLEPLAQRPYLYQGEECEEGEVITLNPNFKVK